MCPSLMKHWKLPFLSRNVGAGGGELYKTLSVHRLAADFLYSLCRDREAMTRLGFGATFFEGIGCALWGTDSSLLFLEAANTPLPCHDNLWVRLTGC